MHEGSLVFLSSMTCTSLSKTPFKLMGFSASGAHSKIWSFGGSNYSVIGLGSQEHAFVHARLQTTFVVATKQSHALLKDLAKNFLCAVLARTNFQGLSKTVHTFVIEDI